ncbi:MAG: hypothetical protein CFE23_13560 [Flavobacterium sp. BFFFF1]|uniref:YqjF family protein n=1 Tax=Flavobacterium sp. BFFFF1 TaxID=2015557 RepID=UPI000BCE3117|nr:DUF2071 domain-containing protein [Flavobacterium sp. BFFFF1]OYU79526.1 MAG: hypothetical protein CFE23_13560 [Flavobacterium sp. BFFFF1]
MSFLKAAWKNLGIINYEIDPAILEPYVPKGTTLDFWNGKCYVSVIGFLFADVRILGIKFPYHVNFEEVNLRFYVKRTEKGKDKRGVVFIKEIVPKPAISIVANLLYNEHYETLKMSHSFAETADNYIFTYNWFPKKQANTIRFEMKKEPIAIPEGSEAEFITEHYFGYTKVNGDKTFEYEVTHPRWQQYEVTDYGLEVDFEQNYGKAFSFLKNQKPISVMVAKGSTITIERKKTIV